jgi:hypothetical protein
MDILNFISWIKAGSYRATLPTDVPSLLPIGAKDASRDDGYLPLAVNAAPLQTLYNTSNVTQITSIATDVAVDGLNGIITTVSSTLAANAKIAFTVNNPDVKATSKVLVSVQYPTASAGIPVVGISNIIDGKFGILLANGGNAALNDVVKIHYLVIV